MVSVPALGVEATVGAGQSMLEALEEAGVDVMSDCRKGECDLCQV
ncbi:2Fe-2S iron-sulfur cluster-binding protein [Streptomyces sp. LN785]